MKLQIKVKNPQSGYIEQQSVIDLQAYEPSFSRREALGKLLMGGAGALALLSGTSTFLSGCIGESDVKFGTFTVDDSAPVEGCTDKTNSAKVACTSGSAGSIKSIEKICISRGSHDHAVGLTVAEIEAGVAIDRIYLRNVDTVGLPVSHVHWFSLTQEEVLSLKSGTLLTIDVPDGNAAATEGGPEDDQHMHPHVIELSCIA